MSVYVDERRQLIGNSAESRDKIDRRLVSIDHERERVTKLLVKGILDENQGDTEMRQLRQERVSLLAERAELNDADPEISIHPGVAGPYLDSLNHLEEAIRGQAGPAEGSEFASIRTSSPRSPRHPTRSIIGQK